MMALSQSRRHQAAVGAVKQRCLPSQRTAAGISIVMFPRMFQPPMDVNVSKASFVVVVLRLAIVVQKLKVAVEVVVHVRVVVMSLFVMTTVQIATVQKTAHEAL